MNIINGKEISKNIINELKEKCDTFKQNDIFPKLVVISTTDDSASKIYIKNKKKSAEEIGILFEEIHIDAKNEVKLFRTLLDKISILNHDNTVTGILVQKPTGLTLRHENIIFSSIYPEKDVDGFSPINEYKLYENDYSKILIPCTVQGIIELLERSKIELEGKHIVIIGRSNIVGKPLALALLNKNATVTVCHSKTKDLKKITRTSDILISATGKLKMIDHTYAGENTTVFIDVGINKDENGKLCGDMDFEKINNLLTDRTDYPYGYDAKEKYITPVPGGVGPMTVAMLMSNVLKAAKIQFLGEKYGESK